ncbi:hypothetical protein Dimus_005768 [Dionaea muscipula]
MRVRYALEEGATSRGLAARLEGRSPKKLRIKLKLRSLGKSSHSHPETTTLCVVDAASTLGPLPGRGEFTYPEMLHAGMTKGRRLQIPSGAFARWGKGRIGAGGKGRPDSPDRARVSTRDLEDRDRRSSRNAEDHPPKPPSSELKREKRWPVTTLGRVKRDACQLVLFIFKISLVVGSRLSLWEALLVALARP